MEELQQIEAQVKDGALRAVDAVKRVAKVEQTMEDCLAGCRSSNGAGVGGGGTADAFTPRVGGKVLVRSMGTVATVLKIRPDGKV